MGTEWHVGRCDLYSAPGGCPHCGGGSVIELAVAGRTGCALQADRTVSCWQLEKSPHGPGVLFKAEPVYGLRDPVQLGYDHSWCCALEAHGNAACWGWDDRLRRFLGQEGVVAGTGLIWMTPTAILPW